MILQRPSGMARRIFYLTNGIEIAMDLAPSLLPFGHLYNIL
ncbi:MAG: hypothetical protein Q8O87_03945 [bacterium]|nr:hypothetical protein [bacterium]